MSFMKEFQGKPKVSYVTVFKRPGLHKFLNQIAEFADVVLFTAGLEGMLTQLNGLGVHLLLLCSLGLGLGGTHCHLPYSLTFNYMFSL